MTACVFDCDALFERGYIRVGADGLVEATAVVSHSTAALSRRLSKLAGRRCAAFGPSNAQYFAWHRIRTFRERPGTPI